MNEEEVQNIQRILVEHFTKQLGGDQEKFDDWQDWAQALVGAVNGK